LGKGRTLHLNEAIRKGDMQAVEKAIAANSNLNRLSGEEKMTPLMVAAEAGQAAIVGILLAANVDVNCLDDNHHTALAHAVAGNRPEIVKLLIDRGAELSPVGTMWPYNTPLMFAVMKGRAKIAQALLNGGAEVDAADQHGNTALMKASQFGKAKAVQGLLRYGADPNRTNQAGQTALFCCLGQADICRLLLDAGANPNHQDNEGRTPLMIAAKQPKAPCVRMLLEAGADPNPAGNGKVSPLWHAVEARLAPTVRWLLEAGAHPDPVWPEYDSLDQHLIAGTTPLMYAAATGRIKLVRLLLDAGAQVLATNDRQQTALQLAIANRHSKIAELLMSQGSNLSETERQEMANGQLLDGSKTGDLVLVQNSLAMGADVNLADADYQQLGYTPLMHACQAGHAQVAAVLVASGADLARTETTNIMTGDRLTAFHLAAYHGHAPCVELLAEADADLNPLNGKGDTPLMIAAEVGHLEVVEVLIRHGAKLDIRSFADDQAVFGSDESQAESRSPVANLPTVSGNEKDIPREFDRIADEGSFCGRLPPFTAIEKAAFQGHLHVVRALFEAGARNPQDALFAACLGLREDVVQWLLKAGVKPVGGQKGQPTSLHALGRFHAEVRVQGSSRKLESKRAEQVWLAALAAKQQSIAAHLIAADADIEACDELGRTPLHTAVHNLTYQTVQAANDDSYQIDQGHEVDPTGFVQLLLKFGANPNAVDRFGRTPVMLAAVRNEFMGPYFPQVVEALVAAGADLNARDLFGRTTLMLAARFSPQSVLHQLKLGADPTLTDHWGRNPIHWAVLSHADSEAIRKLTRAGFDLNQLDQDGLSTLDYAMNVSAEQTATILKKAGVPETLGSIDRFCRAVEGQKFDEALKCLDKVSNLHQQVASRSAWVAALTSQNERLIETLLNRGADIHARLSALDMNHYGMIPGSALHWAATYGLNSIARMLLRHGADPAQLDQLQRTPVTYAAVSRSWELMDELLRAGGRWDPLAAVYAELRVFDHAAELSDFKTARAAITNLFGQSPKQLEGLEAVAYWAIRSQQEAQQYQREHSTAHPFVAGREALRTKVDSLIAQAHEALADKSFLIVDLCESVGCGDANFIGLFPTKNQLSVVAAMGTHGNEEELTNVDLLAFLLQLEQQQPFQIMAVCRDTLRLRFLDDVGDPLKLGRELYGICSDVIHQGYGSMDQLVDVIRNTRTVNLWWD
jgi:ankyrin repeat protein